MALGCRTTVSAILALWPVGAAIARGGDPVVTTDLLRIRMVTAIDVAADGSRAVYSVRSIAPTEPRHDDDEEGPGGAGEGGAAPQDRPGRGRLPQYEYRSHLYLIDLLAPASRPRQLTFGPRRDVRPILSPEGRRVAFLRASSEGREQQERMQAWVMRLDGGEARQLTSFEHGAGLLDWSPDGRLLLVQSPVDSEDLQGAPPWPLERPRRTWRDAVLPEGQTPRPDGTLQEIRAWLEANARDQDPVVITRLHFQDETELRGPLRFDHLHLVDADDADRPAKRITDGFFDHGDAAFMPDGRSVVYAARKRTDVHPDRLWGTDLWRVDADGGNDRLFLALDGWSLRSPRPGRDGSVVAFLGQRSDEPAFRQEQLGVAPVQPGGAGSVVWLTDESGFDGSVDEFVWGAGRSTLLFTAALQGGFPLTVIGEGLIEPAPLVQKRDGLPVGVVAFDAAGASLVCAVTSPANPCVLIARDASGERVVEDLNTWVAEKVLSLPVEGRVSRPDGVSVQYWTMEPRNRRPGQKYPLALQMHGGPSAMWGPGEPTMWHEFQLLCSFGFGVVYCNPRGSGGYGYRFQRGNFQDWGQGPAGDVLAVVDEAVLDEWVDPQRLVITGGSYAGYLTAWIIAHDDRFKAAVAQRGVYDLETFFGEGNAWRLVEFAMGGNPYDARYRDVIERNSPISVVNRIRTPLLIIHGSGDLRTGVSQSEMLYRSLKALGRPVEYVRYPGAGHDLSRTGDPTARMDRLNRIVEFFLRYVEGPR